MFLADTFIAEAFTDLIQGYMLIKPELELIDSCFELSKTATVTTCNNERSLLM